MAKRIAFFNHKGGVSKTTTTFNLGWMLAEKGKKVVMVDADPQCNLTGIVMGYRGPTELESFFTNDSERNIKAGLAPAFESRPTTIKAVECVEVPGRSGLLLLPGHIRLAEYEVTLGIAQELSGSLKALQNLPGALSYLLEKTAEHHNADYVLIDMSPSLSSINQNLLMTSEFFIIPAAPDFYSVMAMDSLANVFPKWKRWASEAQKAAVFAEAAYKFPTVDPRMLGVVIQNYRPRGGAPAEAFKKWITEIDAVTTKTLIPALSHAHMLLSDEQYKKAELENGYKLATIPDFNSLIAKSQLHRTPVFALTEAQFGAGGVVRAGFEKSRGKLHDLFSKLADKVIQLTQ